MIDVLKYIMVETGRKGAAKKKVLKDFPVVEKLDVDIEDIGDEMDGSGQWCTCIVYVFQKG